VADEIAAALEEARSPLIVTTYLGRDPAAVAGLTALCELAGVGVLESVPMRMNFPARHPLQVGYHWNQPEQHPVLAEADVILVLGSDVPWIPAHNRPDPAARVYVVDVDPLKTSLPLWHVPATRYAQADLGLAAGQLAARLAARGRLDPAAVADRAARRRAVHDAQRAAWSRQEQPAPDGTITPEYLVACVREAAPPGTLFLTEAITSYPAVSEHLAVSQPARLAAGQRRRLAGLGRRGGRRRQAGRAGSHWPGTPARGRSPAPCSTWPARTVLS